MDILERGELCRVADRALLTTVMPLGWRVGELPGAPMAIPGMAVDGLSLLTARTGPVESVAWRGRMILALAQPLAQTG